MEKKALETLFRNAQTEKAAFVAVKIQTEGSSKPEIIINPHENIEDKLAYYMSAYDDDLTLISAKGKKDIRIVAAAQGDCFADIQTWLIPDRPEKKWKQLISDAIDKVYNKMIAETPPETEEEQVDCGMMKEGIKGMFLQERHTEAEERFICDNIAFYEELFEVCMNGDDLAFKKGLYELQKRQNEAALKGAEDE